MCPFRAFGLLTFMQFQLPGDLTFEVFSIQLKTCRTFSKILHCNLPSLLLFVLHVKTHLKMLILGQFFSLCTDDNTPLGSFLPSSLSYNDIFVWFRYDTLNKFISSLNALFSYLQIQISQGLTFLIFSFTFLSSLFQYCLYSRVSSFLWYLNLHI